MRKREERAKRIYRILLSMGMLLTLLSVPVWAAEPLHENEAGEETAVLGAWDTRRAVSGSGVDVSGGRKWELI